jgi:hypothetical protein
VIKSLGARFCAVLRGFARFLFSFLQAPEWGMGPYVIENTKDASFLGRGLAPITLP